jgi:hypothetical protein
MGEKRGTKPWQEEPREGRRPPTLAQWDDVTRLGSAFDEMGCRRDADSVGRGNRLGMAGCDGHLQVCPAAWDGLAPEGVATSGAYSIPD